jgi:hypothetical protein
VDHHWLGDVRTRSRVHAAPEKPKIGDDKSGLLKYLAVDSLQSAFACFDLTARHTPLVRTDPCMLVPMLQKEEATRVSDEGKRHTKIRHKRDDAIKPRTILSLDR